MLVLCLIAGAGRGVRTQTPAPAEFSPEYIDLVVDRMLSARWYPPDPNPPPGPSADLSFLLEMLASPTPALRKAAVRGLGRFENPVDAPRLIGLLDDPNPDVRDEAANALALSLKSARGAAVVPAMNALLAHLAPMSRPMISGAALPPPHAAEALARLRYDEPQATVIEEGLARRANAINATADTVDVLVQFLRANPGRDVSAATRSLLERAASVLEANPLATAGWYGLQMIGETDASLLVHGATLHCRPAQPPECGWEVRSTAISMMDPAVQAFATEFAEDRSDAAYQVRIAAMRRQATAIPVTGSCESMIDALTTVEVPVVQLEAVRLLSPRCQARDDIVARLVPLASDFGDPTGPPLWRLPARALETLVRFSPDAAAKIVHATAATFPVWQVRATAARVAGVLEDEAVLVALASDPEPNVRTEAVSALAAIASPHAREASLAALAADDYQLIRAAAIGLRGLPPDTVEVRPLIRCLRRLTLAAKDTSHDPRVAVLQRLVTIVKAHPGDPALLDVDDRNDFPSYLEDFDPQIADLAADVLASVVGVRPTPRPTHRPPQQPTTAELRALPARAIVSMSNGDSIELTLLTNEAPLTVARFVELARAGYYDTLTFHRVEPLFVIQGGSPGANEYMGDARYLRDEIGLERHHRGAVGLSTRGRDTGDAQLFIDLTDQMRLNFEYTIFAGVAGVFTPQSQKPLLPLPSLPWPKPGLEGVLPMDAILEGDRIAGIHFLNR